MTKKPVDPIYTEKFLEDLNRFIENDKKYEDNEATTCEKIFDNSDNYSKEKIYLQEIYSGNFNTTKDRGDALEKLIRELFNRIEFLSGINHPNKQLLDSLIYNMRLFETISMIFGVLNLMIDQKLNILLGNVKIILTQ